MSGDQPFHELTRAQFNALASGYGGVEEIQLLRSGQFSKWMLTVRSIVTSVDNNLLQPAFTLLSAAQDHDPEIFEEVVTYPHILLWAHKCLASVMGYDEPQELSSHLRHVSAIAAVCAHRVGLTDFRIDVPVNNGEVVLPSMGRAVVPSDGGDTAAVTSKNGELQITHADTVVRLSDNTDESWQELRRIHVTHNGLALSFLVDDVDPYRCYYDDAGIPLDGRLSKEDFEGYSQKFSAAWRILVQNYGEYAEAVSATVRAFVPIIDQHYQRVCSSPYAFGGMAMTGATPEWIAFMLLDHAQGTKARAFHDLVPLHSSPLYERRYYAPWIPEPQTLSKLFDGIYRHPLLISYWNTQRHNEEDQFKRINAELQFARWESRVAHGVDTLAESDDITDEGLQVLRAVSAYAGEVQHTSKVDDEIRQLARLTEIDHRLSWRLRNLHPDNARVRRLMNSWVAGVSCENDASITFEVEPLFQVIRHRARERLAISRMADPSAFEALFESPERLFETNPEAQDADLLFASQRLPEARQAYEREILDNPCDPEPWCGVVLLAHESDLAHHALRRCPELVHALHKEIWLSFHYHVSPYELGSWLFPALSHIDDRKFVFF